MRLKHPIAQQARVEGEAAILREYLDAFAPGSLRTILVDRDAARLVRTAVVDITTFLRDPNRMALRACAWDELLAEALGE